MRLSLTADERALRQSVRDFLRANVRLDEDIPRDLDARVDHLRAWQAACHAAGFVGRSWPADHGGGGRPPSEQMLIDQEFAIAGAAPFAGPVGLLVLGPAIVAFGTDEQRARFLPAILSGEELWCQGFSEPDAGSDLAALRTVAVEDRDGYVIRGQKTWTSWAQYARWCGVLARTDAEAPKHKGLSLLIVDMASPGISVAPMEQITGLAEFSEVFFDDVRVPKAALLGSPGQGWAIAMHVLGHERGTAALRAQIRLRSLLDKLVADTAATFVDGEPLAGRNEVRQQLARALIEIEVLKHHTYRSVGRALDGTSVGSESSSVKLLRNRSEQQLGIIALETLGTSLVAPEPRSELDADLWHEMYLYSRAVSVYGGSEQIQRNIIADRVLRLPRS
jgi:alkylation response protein AidB-like acyl-CoA dehydrogenase